MANLSFEFYIIFKDNTTFSGTTDCSRELFVKNIINPMINNIYSYQFYPCNTVDSYPEECEGCCHGSPNLSDHSCC